MPSLPDIVLAEQAGAVTGEDVRDVVRVHGAFIARSLRYLGVPESDLEDAAQEVFVVVHRRLGTFEGRAALSTWLYGVCARVASAQRRRAHRRYETVVPEPPESAVAPSQEADFERTESRRRLLAVLDGLDDEKRAVFVLYEIERQPMKDVAEALGCPLQTAYYRLHAARTVVLAAFQELRKGEGRS